MRSDAQHNRQRLLDAAEQLLATRGTGVSVAEIVAAAGVGPPTLYRHFGTKQGLLDAVEQLHSEHAAALMVRALAQPTGWEGLVSTVNGSIEFARTNLAVRNRPPIAPSLERFLLAGWRELVERAHAEGSVRTDFMPTDVPFLMGALAEVARLTDYDPSLQERYVALLLEGLRPDPREALPGRAPHPEEIRESLGANPRRS